MNDQPPLGLDNGLTWRSRANAYRRDRVAQLRGQREAAIRRLAQRDASIQDVMDRVLDAWQDIETRLPRIAQTLDLHYIAGFSNRDVAALLSGSVETSAYDLRLGRAWLIRAAQPRLSLAHPAVLEFGADASSLTGPQMGWRPFTT